jgi:hypothetical protein
MSRRRKSSYSLIHQVYSKNISYSGVHFPKLDLSLPELDLFNDIQRRHRSRHWALQHYTAHLLFWTTGVRPSSMLNTKKDSTSLKWQHVRFFMTQDGPAAEIDFQTLKGYAPGEENLLLLLFPIRSQQYFADAAAHLFALACVSNVFVWPISLILTMSTDDIPRPIPITYEASTRPVFVNGHSQNNTTTLTSERYNVHLTQDCIDAGFWGRFTAYSWRRTALTERNLAHHKQSTPIYH